MFHIRSNFNARGPISQVPASWFNKVASFLNNLVPGYGLKFNKTADGPSVISLDPEIVPKAVTHKLGTPDDKTDKAIDEYLELGGETWKWAAGGENGLKVDCYCKIVTGQDEHLFERVTLTFSKDGLLTKAEKSNEQKVIWA